jgi:hypothetical protein
MPRIRAERPRPHSWIEALPAPGAKPDQPAVSPPAPESRRCVRTRRRQKLSGPRTPGVPRTAYGPGTPWQHTRSNNTAGGDQHPTATHRGTEHTNRNLTFFQTPCIRQLSATAIVSQCFLPRARVVMEVPRQDFRCWGRSSGDDSGLWPGSADSWSHPSSTETRSYIL